MTKYYMIADRIDQFDPTAEDALHRLGDYSFYLHSGYRVLIMYDMLLASIGKRLNANRVISPFTNKVISLPISNWYAKVRTVVSNFYRFFHKPEESIFAGYEDWENSDLVALTGLTFDEATEIITENTTSTEYTSRFSSALWMPVTMPVTVIGAGGIGSHLIFQLSRLRPTVMNIYDPDIVDPSNTSGQLYSNPQNNTYKVSSIADFVKDYSNYCNLNAHALRYENQPLTPVTFTGLDNMSTRKLVYENWKKLGQGILIDGRLAAETLQVYCIQADDKEAMAKYESEALFSEEEAEHTICSYKQTTHVAAMIASVMVSLFTNYVSNVKYKTQVRDVPFYTEMSVSEFKFIVE